MGLRDKAETNQEATYDQLISLIENSQGRLAPIIVACDDWTLRQQLIARYELEARQAKIRPYRLELRQDPSLKAGLEKLRNSDPYLQQGGEAVFTVTGADVLLRVTLRPEESAQTELDQFFGYLQWTREGLREFRYPIVLWVNHRILQELSRRAPDFWGWRKAVLRFSDRSPAPTVISRDPILRSPNPIEEDETLPPLAELQEQIEQLKKTSPNSESLAALYSRLGQVYAQRIGRGDATNLEEEKQAAIAAFQTAISLYESLNSLAALADTFIRLGWLLKDQSQVTEAIAYYQKALSISKGLGNYSKETASLCGLGNAYQSLGEYWRAIDFLRQSLEIHRSIGDKGGEAIALGNLGSVYNSLGEYHQAINFLQQSLEIKRSIGDKWGESASLLNMGNAYYYLGEHHRAIDFHQRSLEIKRSIGDKGGEAISLGNLGNAYNALADYQRAIDFHQQSLEIKRTIGDKRGEAISLGNLGNAYDSLNEYQRSINFYQQSLEIQRTISDKGSEAISLRNLGNAYYSLNDYQRAIEFHQQSLEIQRSIGNKAGEGLSLLNIGHALAKLDQHFNAIQHYKQALAIYTDLKLDHMIEDCKTAIYRCNQIISATPHASPQIRDPQPPPEWYTKSLPKNETQHTTHQKIPIWLYFILGLAIALVIWWLKR